MIADLLLAERKLRVAIRKLDIEKMKNTVRKQREEK